MVKTLSGTTNLNVSKNLKANTVEVSSNVSVGNSTVNVNINSNSITVYDTDLESFVANNSGVYTNNFVQIGSNIYAEHILANTSTIQVVESEVGLGKTFTITNNGYSWESSLDGSNLGGDLGGLYYAFGGSGLFSFIHSGAEFGKVSSYGSLIEFDQNESYNFETTSDFVYGVRNILEYRASNFLPDQSYRTITTSEDFKITNFNKNTNVEIGYLYANTSSIVIGNSTANVVISGSNGSLILRSNGSVGTSGQVLTSNGTVAYWSTLSGGGGSVNSDAVYIWTNNHTWNKHLAIGNNANVDYLNTTSAVAGNSASIVLSVQESVSGNLTGTYYGISTRTEYTHTGNASINVFGNQPYTIISNSSTGNISTTAATYSRIRNYGSGRVSSLIGDWVISENYGSGNVSTGMYGIFNQSINYGTGNVPNIYSQYNNARHAGNTEVNQFIGTGTLLQLVGNGNVRDAVGFLVFPTTANNTGKITGNSFGIYISNQNTSAVNSGASHFNLYSEGSNTYNIFDGRIGVGNTSPTHKLRVEGDISLTGGVHANGSIGSDGQLLASNGTVAYWTTPFYITNTYSGVLSGNLVFSGNSIWFNNGMQSGNSTTNVQITPASIIFKNPDSVGAVNVADEIVFEANSSGVHSQLFYSWNQDDGTVFANGKFGGFLHQQSERGERQVGLEIDFYDGDDQNSRRKNYSIIDQNIGPQNILSYRTNYLGINDNIKSLTTTDKEIRISDYDVNGNTYTQYLYANISAIVIGNSTANVIISGSNGSLAISTNGSVGTAGQVLTSNGTVTYWSTVSAGVNTSAQYSWTNTHSFSANVTIANSALIANGSAGTNGQVLTSNSSAVYWSTPTPQTEVQVFTTVGTSTWIKPAGAVSHDIIIIGGGGGGGSGRKTAAGAAAFGGGGGSGGSRTVASLPTSAVASNVTITVGGGGAGGASRTSNSVNGQTGGNGNTSSFGTILVAAGGTGGSAGTPTTGLGGTAPTRGLFLGGAGGAGANTNGANPGSSTAATGGGGGGGLNNSSAIGNGGGGGSNILAVISAAAGGTGDGAQGANGVDAVTNSGLPGTGGGGGAASNTVNGGGNGGNGGYPGGGGGGGGAALDGIGNSGAGGNGGDGIVIVITYF